MKGTGGTETSKYPEEKKETSIPQVAASERGRAQTVPENREQWSENRNLITGHWILFSETGFRTGIIVDILS